MFAKKCNYSLIRGYLVVFHTRNMSQKKLPIIACKRKEFDYYGKDYGKHEDIPLASNAWEHRKSKGDYFVIKQDRKLVADEALKGPSFQDSPLNEAIVKALAKMNIITPNKVQRKAIDEILSGRNSIIAAETGCGKTLAYLLPVLEQIVKLKHYEKEHFFNMPYAIIITPSRELVKQIYQIASVLSEAVSISTQHFIGGHTKRAIFTPKVHDCDLLIASFGGLSKLITNGVYKLDRLRHVVLDEADTLLDDSFNEQVVHLLKKFPFQHQTDLISKGCQLTMVSATMPKEIPEEFSEFIDVESLTRITSDNLHRLLPHLPQRFIRLGKSQKQLQLLKMLQNDERRGIQTIVFSNKSSTCDWISMVLKDYDIKCISFNGNVAIDFRNTRYESFKKGEVNVMSCTDLGSRGLDTTNVKHVINYDFPNYIVDYIHRCGRVGRLGHTKGAFVTNFISNLNDIELTKKIELSIRKGTELPNVDGNVKRLIFDSMGHTFESDSLRMNN